MDARETALLALADCARQGGWSDVALKKQLARAGLDARDAALATRLCYGVLQNQMLLDYYLSRFSNTPLKRMETKVVLLLRLGLYQMLFLTRIPHSAAVNSAVELARKYCKNPRASGLVNGILRALERKLDQLPTLPARDALEHLSLRFSHPRWLLEEWIPILGEEELTLLLEENNAVPPVHAQVNTLRADSESLMVRLAAEGVEALPHPWLRDCLILNGTGDLESLSAYREGSFYIQDAAARLAVLAADVKPGMRVLDCCAAPGGKTFGLCIAMGDQGGVVACDIHPHKKKLLQAGQARLGLSCMEALTQDASVFRPEWENGFDLVLADVPCSGLGVIRKKPDIRYKDPETLSQLPPIQAAILSNVARYVRPGGALVYATCTLLPAENERVVEGFLSDSGSFAAEPFRLPEPVGAVASGMITLWPHRYHTDGFFIAKLRRKA